MDAVVVLATAPGIGTDVIAPSTVAFGTSLPEIMVAVSAARQSKIELAVGRIMGSDVFNAFSPDGARRRLCIVVNLFMFQSVAFELTRQCSVTDCPN